MQLIVHEGIVRLTHDTISNVVLDSVIGQFPDSDSGTDDAVKFAKARADRLLGFHRESADEDDLFYIGAIDAKGEALAVWLSVETVQ